MSEVVNKIREGIEALVINPIFLNDPKWIARVTKAINPLDIEARVKSSLYTAARKELDTAAMKKHRRTGELDPVTEEDIDKLYQVKWADYLEKKAEKEAKQKAFATVA